MDDSYKTRLKEALQQIDKIFAKHRPRPVMGPFRDGSRKYYVRKRDVTYWDLVKKYPPKPVQLFPPKTYHILQRRHHLTPKRILKRSIFRRLIIWLLK